MNVLIFTVLMSVSLSFACMTNMLRSRERAQKIDCNQVQAVRTLNYQEISGRFEVQYAVNFDDGEPVTVPEDSPQRDTCVLAKLFDVDAEGFVANITFVTPNGTQVEIANLTHSGDTEQGRFNISSDIFERKDWEVLVIDVDPSKYLVYLECHAPDENGQRLPYQLNLLVRPSTNLTQQETEEIQDRYDELLGNNQTSRNAVRLDDECWSAAADE